MYMNMKLVQAAASLVCTGTDESDSGAACAV